MIRISNYYRWLEKKSKLPLTKNQLVDSIRDIIKGKQIKKFPTMIVFSNFKLRSKVRQHYFFRYVALNITNKDGYFIYSKIIPEGDEKNHPWYMVVIVTGKGKNDFHYYSCRLETKKWYGLCKIVSGGQTGADQGGLLAGQFLGLWTGGVAPKDYLTTDGSNVGLRVDFGLSEHKSASYPPRTIHNVRESHGTIIFGNSKSRGSLLTLNTCKKYGKSYYLISMKAINDFEKYKVKILNWLILNNIRVLNVAGNRENKQNGIARKTFLFLVNVISRSGLAKYNASKEVNIWLGDSQTEQDEYRKKRKEKMLERLSKGKHTKKIKKIHKMYN